MMKRLVFLVLLIHFGTVNAQLRVIDLKKIPNAKKLKTHLDFIKENEKYYQSWSGEWSFDKNKDEICKGLEAAYNEIKLLKKHNLESRLLLGLMCHYFHNLDYGRYLEEGEQHLKLAIQLKKSDYRSYWMLGVLQGASTRTKSGMNNFLQAEKYLPSRPDSSFWGQYSYYAYMAMMPHHVLKGLENQKKVTGKESSFEQFIKPITLGMLESPHPDSAYAMQRSWRYELDSLAYFDCTAMGLHLQMDTNWQIQPMSIQKGMCGFKIMSPIKDETKPGYSILILASAMDTSTKENYLSKFSQAEDEVKPAVFKNLKQDYLAKQIINKNYYVDQGGAHIYLVLFDRPMPKEPGLIFERPADLPKNDGGMTYMNPSTKFKRFETKIRYLVMLDACETIHEEALKGLNYFLEKCIQVE